MSNADEKCAYCHECDKCYADNDGGAWCYGCERGEEE